MHTTKSSLQLYIEKALMLYNQIYCNLSLNRVLRSIDNSSCSSIELGEPEIETLVKLIDYEQRDVFLFVLLSVQPELSWGAKSKCLSVAKQKSGQ